MSEFDDLFEELVPQGTVEFTLSKVFVRSKEPLVLIMKHAGDDNAAYESLRTKMVKELNAATDSGDKKAVLDLTIRLHAQTVIEGWKNANRPDGITPLPYSPATAIELFRHLVKRGGRDQLEQGFAFALNVNNFRGSTAAIEAALGK